MILKTSISNLLKFFYTDSSNISLLIFWNSLFVAFFLLPLGINIPTPFFITAMILGVINIFKSKTRISKENRVLLAFPLYFIVLCISLIYTDHFQEGLDLTIRSASLFFFPLIFLYVKEDAATVKRLFDFLLVGIVISFFINLFFGLYSCYEVISSKTIIGNDIEETISTFLYALKQGGEYLIGTEFSKMVNPNYISLYILLVLSYYLKNKMTTKLQTFIFIILFLYLFLLASRAAYLILFIMCLILIFNIKDNSKKYTMVIMLLLGTALFISNSRVFNSYKEYKKPTSEEVSSTTIEKTRLLTWYSAWQLIKQSPLIGYGVGDANEVLIEKYKELNYIRNYRNRYNAHNQFLQTYLQTGLIGFSILLYIFILLGIRLQRSKNEFLVFIVLTISILFESMLVRFNGIVFLSIIIPLLLKERSILSSRIIRNT